MTYHIQFQYAKTNHHHNRHEREQIYVFLRLSKSNLNQFCLDAKLIEKKEVDFLVTIDKKPWFAVEAKIKDVNASPHLFYFKDKLKIPICYQVVKQNGVDKFTNGVRVVSASSFLSGSI